MALHWGEERYVRLYTRDTATRARMPWQARALHAELLRKVDRSGLLSLDADEPIEALADLVRMPVEVVREALPHLQRKEWVCLTGNHLVIPNFLEAQEATQSDALRAKAYRERKRLEALEAPSQSVTPTSRVVTEHHETVTDRHEPTESSLRTVPSRTVPNQELSADADPPDFALTPPPSKPEKEPLPFKPAEAVAAIERTSSGRFVASPLDKGKAIFVTGLIRKYPDIREWESVGRWMSAGGDGWKKTLDVRSIGEFETWLAHARKKAQPDNSNKPELFNPRLTVYRDG